MRYHFQWNNETGEAPDISRCNANSSRKSWLRYSHSSGARKKSRASFQMVMFFSSICDIWWHLYVFGHPFFWSCNVKLELLEETCFLQGSIGSPTSFQLASTKKLNILAADGSTWASSWHILAQISRFFENFLQILWTIYPLKVIYSKIIPWKTSYIAYFPGTYKFEKKTSKRPSKGIFENIPPVKHRLGKACSNCRSSVSVGNSLETLVSESAEKPGAPVGTAEFHHPENERTSPEKSMVGSDVCISYWNT